MSVLIFISAAFAITCIACFFIVGDFTLLALAFAFSGLTYSLHYKKKQRKVTNRPVPPPTTLEEELARKEEREIQEVVAEMAKHIWCSTDQLEDFLRTGTLPTEYLETPVLMASGETVRYYGAAIYEITKNKAVGRTGGGAGASIRVAKGVTVRSGRSASQTIYGDVTEKYSGEIVLTDHRLVFLHPQKGFEMKLSSLVAVTAAGGSQVVVQAKNKSYTFYLGSPNIFTQAIRQ